MAVGGNDLVGVRLMGTPVRLWERSREHGEELTREFALLALGDQEGEHVPARLLALIEHVTVEYEAFTEEAENELAHALSGGRSLVDLVYRVPAAAAEHARALRDLLNEADAYCARGALLTLATPEDLRSFRDWYFEEFIRQIAGEPPRPWRGPLA